MPGLGNARDNVQRVPRYGLIRLFALVFVLLGLGASAWISHLLGQPLLTVLLVVGTLVLAGVFFLLIVQLQFARAQRDQALAWVNETQWQLSDETRKLDARIERHAAMQHEIAELRIQQQLLAVQAHHDSLTGLANRLLLADRFQFAVERAKRSGKSFALLMIDLNDFKSVNDHYGHPAGDAVLVTMARRLVSALRASDTVSRLGGDEFVLIVEAIEDPMEITQISEKLFTMLADPITLNTVVVSISASIGLAWYPKDGVELNDLMKVADHAMYECKSSGLMDLH